MDDSAIFDDTNYCFILKKAVASCKLGKYDLLSKVTDGIPYRLSHPLAQYVIKEAKALDLGSEKIIFEKEKSTLRITLPDSLINTSGYMVLSTLDVTSFDNEQYSLFTAYTKNGLFLSQEDCEKLFLCAGTVVNTTVNIDSAVFKKLRINSEQHVNSKLSGIDSRNLKYFREEEERIFRWEKDLIANIEHELDTIKRQIREQERQSRQSTNLEEKATIARKIDELERLKRHKRNELADREDEIGERRREMIAELDRRMVRQTSTDNVFIIEWQVK